MGAAGAVLLVAVGTNTIINFSGDPRGAKQDGSDSVSGFASQDRDEGEVVNFPALGASLESVSLTDVKPKVDSIAAIKYAVADGIRSDVQGDEEPVTRLAYFTNSLLGQKDPADLQAPLFDHVLVWDIVYADAPQEVYGPSDGGQSAHTTPCDLHIIVDATSGQVVEGFQGNCGRKK